jgi:hypothetical protein
MRIVTSCLLVVFVGVCHVALGQTSRPGAVDAELARDIQALRGKMAYHRARSASWAELAQFDQALSELKHANEAWQAILTLTNDLPADQKVKWLTPTFDLPQETAVIHAHQRAWEVAVRQFELPAETMGFVYVRQYQDVKPPLWSVAYRVRDKALTVERMAANLDRYVAGQIMPESKGFVAAYQADGPTVKRTSESEIPHGMAPYYFLGRPSGFLMVMTTGLRSTGGLLLHDGEVVELKNGPAKGPAVYPRESDKSIEHMAVNHLVTNLWVICPSDGNQILARYDSTRWDCLLKVTFSKGQITRIEEGVEGRRQSIFNSADGKRLTAEQAKQLGAYYCLHRQMSKSGFLTPVGFFEPNSIKFDESSARWTLTYQRGRREIAGWFVTIVLDEKGGLVDFSEDVVLR